MKIKGVALIVVLVFTFVFSAIILAIVLTSTTSYRRASFYHDKLVAQQLAETGIQDALNKLNYIYHDTHYYGFINTGVCKTNNDYSGEPNVPYTLFASSLNIPNSLANDGVKVSLTINSDNTTLDKLVAVGSYRGRSVTIQTNIRTISNYFAGPAGNLSWPLNDTTNQDTKGIPEAFNKHVIYASTVNGNTTIETGNVCYSSGTYTPAAGSDATSTQTGIVPPGLPMPVLSFVPPDPNGLMPDPSSWDKMFKANASNQPYAGTSPYQVGLPVGVTYSGNSLTDETYTINSAPIGSEKWLFVQKATTTLTVKINGSATMNSNGMVESGTSGNTAYLSLDFSLGNNPNILGQLKAQKDITLTSGSGTNPIGTVGQTTLWAGGQITISSASSYPTINGDIVGISGSGISFPTSGTNTININGAIVSATNVTFPLVTVLNLTLNLNKIPADSMPAAILIYPGTLTVNGTPTIVLSPTTNQKSAIIAYSSGVSPVGVSIGATGSVDFVNNPIQNLGNKATIISYSQNGVSNVTLGSSTTYAKINGLIYSYGGSGGNNGNITLGTNSGTIITGSLVANGTVNLGGGSITYDSSLYKNTTNPSIYSGFTGGRRVYVPTSWSVQW